MRTISADLHDVKGPHDKRFRRCVAGGHAALGLRAHYQQQLALARKECGFEYIRLHGLLHDDMGVYREEDGKPIYGRQHVDKFYDFLLDIGIRPLVEFSLMPKALASGEKTLFYWRGNITPPTSYDKWQELIRRAVLHWERRYGREEISKWYFEVWNEPNLPGFWTGTQEEYFALYRAAAQAVKSVCADYRIGGPATAGMVWITDTINFCNENNVALDFITSHTYGVDGHFDATGKSVLFISNHPHALWKGVQNAHDEIRQSVMSDLELHVTEWGTSYSSRDPVHDSYYSAAYILSKLKLCEGAYESMAYWTFSDVFEELRPPMRPFHGGFGLVTLHGLKKAGYFSYQWLNQLGNAELACDDADAWICCDDRGVQALFWNYTHLEQDVHNQLFFSQDQPPKAKQPTQLKLAGLKPGPYELAVHRAGYRSNDVYSDYLDLGSPDTLSRDEVEAMRQRHSGAPEAIQRVTVAAAGSFSLYLELRDNDVIFVKLTETGASQESLPVYKTVSHALVDHMGVGQFVGLQTRMVRWIIRNKVLEVCRLMGWLLVAIDGTGYVSFKKRHCPRCLRFRTQDGFGYRHHVLEAKIVGPGGLAISIAHEMIEDPDGITEDQYDNIKQDCELKAFTRLAEHLSQRFPRLRICLLGDANFACGPAISICEANKWKYVFTFKQGRTPALWEDFEALQQLSTHNSLLCELPDGKKQYFRWANDLNYHDSNDEHHEFDAVRLCEVNRGKDTTFAWITNLPVNQKTVTAIADHGGRGRWIIENEGFNYRKNSGLNLEHAYSHSPSGLKIFYTLLQIAHMIMQLLIKSSLLKKLARQYKKANVIALFGSLKNIPRRLLECFRNYLIPDEAFDFEAGRRMQIRLDTS